MTDHTFEVLRIRAALRGARLHRDDLIITWVAPLWAPHGVESMKWWRRDCPNAEREIREMLNKFPGGETA